MADNYESLSNVYYLESMVNWAAQDVLGYTKIYFEPRWIQEKLDVTIYYLDGGKTYYLDVSFTFGESRLLRYEDYWRRLHEAERMLHHDPSE